jgi:hypothetical protein
LYSISLVVPVMVPSVPPLTLVAMEPRLSGLSAFVFVMSTFISSLVAVDFSLPSDAVTRQV